MNKMPKNFEREQPYSQEQNFDEESGDGEESEDEWENFDGENYEIYDKDGELNFKNFTKPLSSEPVVPNAN